MVEFVILTILMVKLFLKVTIVILLMLTILAPIIQVV